MTFTVPRSFRVFITALMCGMTLFLFGAVIANGHPAIDQDGITKTNGKRVSIPWSEVTRLVIRDPPSVGWGSVTIEGASGRTIWVPRRLPEIGAILYLVKKHSNAVEIYGHEVQRPWIGRPTRRVRAG